MLVLSANFTLGGLHIGERKMLRPMLIPQQLLLKKFWEKMGLPSYTYVSTYAFAPFENRIMIDPFELGLLIFRWRMVVQTLDFIMEQIPVQTRLTINLISLHMIMLGIFLTDVCTFYCELWYAWTLQTWLFHMQDAPIREAGDVDNSKFNGTDFFVFPLIFELSIFHFLVCWLYFFYNLPFFLWVLAYPYPKTCFHDIANHS